MAELAYMVAGSVLEKLGSVAKDEISLAWGMKKELRKLKDKTLMLKSVFKDAEKKQARDEQLRAWLVQVKDVFNDAVDVLDEVDCEALRRQVVKEYGSVGIKVRRFFSCDNPVAFRFSIARKVKEIRERLDEIVGNIDQFQLIRSQLVDHHEGQSHLIDREWRDRMTDSFVNASEVIGRDKDKAAIIQMLLSQDDPNSVDNLSVIPVVGIGGLGKTTLAKSVYNEDKIGASFELKLWVCVSLDFDVTRLVREILRETKALDDISNMSREQLQTSLRSILQGKKFLLVLDDVWNEDRDKWLELRAFLAVGAKGRKIIVTTRTTLVSSIMTRTLPHQLEGLSDADSLTLFFKCAFEDEKLIGRCPGLDGIGKEIVGKCGGVPLALKTLGSLLYSKTDEAEWIRIRDSEIWELERGEGRILPALRLSYNAMSSCLKQCFSYCSTYPEDAEMYRIELIHIWMALGILQSTNEETELEDIGQFKFKELCARAFFQFDDDDDDDDTVYGLMYGCCMHDLIYDLARSITESECCIVKSGRENIPESVRHLRIELNRNAPTVLKKFKKLRSLYIGGATEECNIDEFISTCITQLRYLLIFDISGLSFEVLPRSIGTLKHLRYLDLSQNDKIKRLPNSICVLQNLQTLLLHGCKELEELPSGLRKLVSLRALCVTTKQEYFQENGIGCLKSLRTLFIEECKNLLSLPHDMRNCTTLRTLFLRSCKQLDLATKPNDAINKLSLQSLLILELPQMTALPQWLKGASHGLKLLVIEDCNKLVALPEWLPNFVSLQKLVIKKCEELSSLPNGMEGLTSLTHLEIVECKHLHMESGHGRSVQLKLQTLIIQNLPQTTTFPNWLRRASNSLRHLEIGDCENFAALPEWLPNFASLETLELWSCPKLLALPEGMQQLTSLTDLEIINCKNLELASKSNEVVQLCLQRFYIHGLPETRKLPEWLQGAAHTLQQLHINGCGKLDALPEWLPSFVSLQKLVIKKCEELSGLPNGMEGLTSLTHLEIVDCKHLNLESGHGGSVQLKLQTLIILNLPQATTFPNWLRGASDSVRRLEIRDCENLVALPEWLPNFASLETLEIWSCPKLLALPEGIQQLTSLTDLEIGNCQNLELASKSNEVVQLCLQRFSIQRLDKTNKLPEWLRGAAHTLQHLYIRECGKLDALPEWLPDLTSLKRISISTCPKLSSLPEGMSRLTSLTDFEITNPSAALRANTAHIPNIRISDNGRGSEVTDEISDITEKDI